ncbi:MAG: glycosyl hydrolase 2 galactose-binding domain-containing protein, partial [Bacteroidota bacterium]
MRKVDFLFFSFLINLTFVISQNQFNWSFFHPIKKEWKNYQTHGSIQEKLIQTGELPSPFFGLNENKFDWIEEHTWELISDTIFGDSILSKIIDIRLPSIDTYTSIYWNDSLVLLADNAFRPFVIQVLMKPNSKNTVRAVFTPPILYHKARYENESFHYPAPNDPHKIAISNLTRKPQYQFGWDWTARMNTLGFLEPVSWEFQQPNKLEKFSIETNTINTKRSEILYKFLFNSIDQNIRIVSSLFGTIDLKSNDTLARWKNTIDNPQLWWPNGLGDSYLYHDTIRVYLKSGVLTESKVIQFGIRKSELVQDKDKWGTSYVLNINDKPVFCKG